MIKKKYIIIMKTNKTQAKFIVHKKEFDKIEKKLIA